MARPVAVVVGIGPGIGGALARRFANEGYAVAGLSRKADPGDRADGVTPYAVDVTDLDALKRTLAKVRDELGPVHALLWNVGSGVWGTIDQIDVAGMELAWRTNVLAAAVAVQELLPDLRANGGQIVFTGATASRRGRPFTTAFAPAKAGQRALAEALARHLGPEGVHVALVVIDGVVDLPSTRARMPDKPDEAFVSPDAVADTVMHLVRQDRRAWTFELELRPHVESW